VGSGPKQLQKDILEENHSSGMAGHFAVSHLYAALSCSCGGKGCTVMCTSVWLPTVCNSHRGRKKLQATITSNPCSKALPNYWGRYARITPKTESGNKFAIVFQDFLTSGP